ncbi:MAG: hypothetical protein COA44_01230 [Arcobacter sp.]|nr:MAG: hypothetical protein COA44_01230 [Arcobacter sp.]
MKPNKIIFFLALVTSLLQAEEFGDTFKIRIGGYLLSDNETTLSATTPYLVGAKINLKDDLGMETKTNVFRLDGHYRFSDVHKVEFAYYSINTRGSNTISKDLNFDGATYQAGANINSYLDMDIYKLNYAYSFYHNEKVELSIGAGLHFMDISTGLSGNAVIDNQPASFRSESVDVLAPLPVIGFDLDYAVSPRFHIRGSIDYFGISIDKYSGSFTDVLISADYQAFDNFGMGLGLNVTNLDAKVDDTTKYELNQTITGFLAYLSYNY